MTPQAAAALRGVRRRIDAAGNLAALPPGPQL